MTEEKTMILKTIASWTTFRDSLLSRQNVETLRNDTGVFPDCKIA
jgi:hypothetical protein